jgi:hypothetical protein
MGSGLGPPGATLAACYKEEQRQAQLPFWQKRAFSASTLCMRWMDDLIQIYLKSLGPPLQTVLTEMRSECFYGDTLKLKKEEGNVAFGFRFRFANGQVCAAQYLKFRESFDAPLLRSSLPMIQGPSGFMADGSRRGVVSGY